MSQTINFNNKDYGLADLRKLSLDELVTLRNLVASALGVASVKTFKDQEAAVDGTWKALEKFDEKMTEESEAESKPKKVKKPKKERGYPKSSLPQEVKRPTRKMFTTIKKIGEHNLGSHGRKERWPNYEDGMTFIDIKEGNGMELWDVYNWEKHGIMQLIPPTDEEFAERRDAWYKKKGRKTPEQIKAEKEAEKAERAAAKAEKAASQKAA